MNSEKLLFSSNLLTINAFHELHNKYIDVIQEIDYFYGNNMNILKVIEMKNKQRWKFLKNVNNSQINIV